MRVATPEPEPEDVEAVLNSASEVIESEQARIRVEMTMTQAVRLGIMLVQWRKMMREGNYSDEWVESAAMDLFHSFFPPFFPTDTSITFEGVDDD
jgi:hypothetical protein